MPSSRFSSLIAPSYAVTESRATATPRPPDPATPAGAARLLASSTPYGSVADALRSFDQERIHASSSPGSTSSSPSEVDCRRRVPATGRSRRPPPRTVRSAASPRSACSPSGSALRRWCCAYPTFAWSPRQPNAGDVRPRATGPIRRSSNDQRSGWTRHPDATISDRIGRTGPCSGAGRAQVGTSSHCGGGPSRAQDRVWRRDSPADSRQRSATPPQRSSGGRPVRRRLGGGDRAPDDHRAGGVHTPAGRI